MGQKIHPTGFRIGIYEPWRSRWYATKKEFGAFLIEDQAIRKYLKTNYRFAAIPKIEIERTREMISIRVHTARPGVLIGRKGAKVERIESVLRQITGQTVKLAIEEVGRPEMSALLVAENVAEQLEKRAAFRRTLKKACQMTMQAGAHGVKITVSGRLGGSEMARTETQGLGSIPLQTLRAKVDYGFTEAKTAYGHIGVKAWINLGEYDLTTKRGL